MDPSLVPSSSTESGEGLVTPPLPLTPHVAHRQPLPRYDDPLELARWDWEFVTAPVPTAVKLLAAVCRWVAESPDGTPSPTPHLRDQLVFWVLRPTILDTAFRVDLGEAVRFGTPITQLAETGGVDVDHPDSAVNTLSGRDLLRLVLDGYELHQLVEGVRELLRDEASADVSEATARWPLDGHLG